jgi:hypothetical protein
MDTMQAEHLSRVRHLREAFSSENEQLVRLLRGADAADAERVVEGRWSAAQVGWHVASVNTRFAALMGGDVPGAAPLPGDFVERPWSEIASAIPGQLDAPRAAIPPAGVTSHDAIAALEASALKMARALDTLTPERGTTLGVTNPLVGTINLYQLGEWAASHVTRHYMQAKQALEP